MCSILFLDSWISGFFDDFFVCARPQKFVSVQQKPFFRLSQPGSCAWVAPFLLCADHTFVLVCVCPCMCIWKCVGKVINIYQYKQNRDDVTCSINTKTEIDVHSDVKQAVKWLVFRHVTECNTNKSNTINVSVFRTLGGVVNVSPLAPESGRRTP